MMMGTFQLFAPDLNFLAIAKTAKATAAVVRMPITPETPTLNLSLSSPATP
jgi:hypothetical protein